MIFITAQSGETIRSRVLGQGASECLYRHGCSQLIK